MEAGAPGLWGNSSSRRGAGAAAALRGIKDSGGGSKVGLVARQQQQRQQRLRDLLQQKQQVGPQHGRSGVGAAAKAAGEQRRMPGEAAATRVDTETLHHGVGCGDEGCGEEAQQLGACGDHGSYAPDHAMGRKGGNHAELLLEVKHMQRQLQALEGQLFQLEV
jgi:hypothetical protein